MAKALQGDDLVLRGDVSKTGAAEDIRAFSHASLDALSDDEMVSAHVGSRVVSIDSESCVFTCVSSS